MTLAFLIHPLENQRPRICLILYVKGLQALIFPYYKSSRGIAARLPDGQATKFEVSKVPKVKKNVTYDLERLMEGATKLSTSEFGEKIIENM